MKRILLALPVIFSIFMMGSAMAALKPYCQKKITTSAFDFFPDTITAYDPLGNPIDIGYLEYGRATAQVTKTLIYRNSELEPVYQGKLYFYAKGTNPTWTVTLTTYANQEMADIQCSVFTDREMECTGMGIYRVAKAFDGGTVDPVCIEFKSYAYLPYVSDPDMLYVKAWKGECGTGELVLDAETSCYFTRVPKQHIVFTEWDNFARFPQCKWMHRADSMPV